MIQINIMNCMTSTMSISNIAGRVCSQFLSPRKQTIERWRQNSATQQKFSLNLLQAGAAAVKVDKGPDLPREGLLIRSWPEAPLRWTGWGHLIDSSSNTPTLLGAYVFPKCTQKSPWGKGQNRSFILMTLWCGVVWAVLSFIKLHQHWDLVGLVPIGKKLTSLQSLLYSCGTPYLGSLGSFFLEPYPRFPRCLCLSFWDS